MKLLAKSTLSMALLAGVLALAPGSASALNIHSIPGVTSGSVFCSVRGNVATLTGTVESRFERKQIEKYVKKNYDFDRVVNLISTSD